MRGIPPPLLPRWIFIGMMTGGLMAVIAIAAVVWWMSSVVNRTAEQASIRIFSGAVEDREHSIEYTARSFARWRTVYEAVEGRNDPAVYRSLGTAATERETFEFLYVVDRDGLPLYGFRPGDARSNLTGFPARQVQIMIEQLRERSVDGTNPMLSGILRVDGRLAILTVGAIMPGPRMPKGVSPPPYLIAGEWLTEEWVADTGGLLLAERARLTPGDAILAEGETGLTLRDPVGRTAGTISWIAPTPGQAALEKSLPMVVSMCIGLLLGSVLVGRIAHRLISMIDHQRQRAQTDALTGLLNRDGLYDRLAQDEIAEALRRREVAVLYLDLNGFKALNDTEGHDAGDAALRRTAEQLRQSLRPCDIIARVGGDEFVCVLKSRRPRIAAQIVTTRILKRAEEPIHYGSRSYQIVPAIGISEPLDGESWTDMIRHADIAMYEAKRRQADQALHYSPEMTKAA